jgi:hypothetical protein
MADNHSRKSHLPNPRVDPSYDVYDEDPLVELARIVSEDGGYFNIADRRQEELPTEQPEMDIGPAASEPDLGVDLETQLMEELELSMAGPEDTAYAESYGEEAYLPAEEGFAAEPAYTAEHAYAPEDSAALAQMSGLPPVEGAGIAAETPVSEVGEWADDWVEDPASLDAAPVVQAPELVTPEPVLSESELAGFRPEYDAQPVAASESADILSSNDLSDLEETLSASEGYFSAETVDLESEFSDAIGDDDGALDDDGIPGIPPVVPLGSGFSAAERDAPQQGRSGRKMFAIAAVLSIAVLGGGVIAMMSSTSMTPSGGTPPVFKADNSPVKAEPDGGDVAAADGAQPVFDVAGNGNEPVEEVLRDRTEKPVDRIIPLEETQQTSVLRPVGGDAAGSPDDKNPARITDRDAPSSTAPKFDPIGPKTVTTMKVNADGTIIRPTLDEKSVAVNDTTDTMIVGGLPTTVSSPETNVAPVNEPKPVPVNVVEINTTSDAAGDVGTVDTQTSPLTEVIAGLPEGAAADTGGVPLPRVRPLDAPAVVATAAPAVQTPLVAQPAKPARTTGSAPVNLLEAAKQAAPRQAAPVSTGSTGAGSGYLVQLSSQRSEEQALAAFNGLKKRYPSLLGNRDANIQRADLGDRGIYYRVRVGPMTDQAGATQFCEQLRSSGGSCFVTR